MGHFKKKFFLKLIYLYIYIQFLNFSLKAEWLYSQGKGRSFQVGDHKALVEYLVSVCSVKKGNDETDVKKLKLILSKAQHHQKQLKEQLSEGLK